MIRVWAPTRRKRRRLVRRVLRAERQLDRDIRKPGVTMAVFDRRDALATRGLLAFYRHFNGKATP